jgi:hypothetical protein
MGIGLMSFNKQQLWRYSERGTDRATFLSINHLPLKTLSDGRWTIRTIKNARLNWGPDFRSLVQFVSAISHFHDIRKSVPLHHPLQCNYKLHLKVSQNG